MKIQLLRRSLLWRIGLPYALLILVLMGLAGVYLNVSLRNFYRDQMADRLLAEARLAAISVGEDWDAGGGPADLEARVKVAAQAVRGRVTVILPGGEVAAESERQPGGMDNHLGRPEVQQALMGRENVQVRHSATLDQDLMYAALPIQAGEETVAVMRVAYPLGEIENTLRNLMGSILLFTAVATLIAILLAFWIARYTLRPLRTLADSVDRVSKGLLPEAEASQGTEDEIGQLQIAFHEMVGQLRHKFDELRGEREKLEAILENMNDAILIVDAEGRVTQDNPAAQRMFDLVIHRDRPPSLIEVARHHRVAELWRKSSASGLPQSTTLEMTAGRNNLQVTANPLSGALEGSVLLAFQDLTRVRRLETVRRDFISNVSHELRTPLASLKALAETLQEGALEDPPAARRFLSQMEDEIDNLTQMVRELLELSRIESGRVPFNFLPVGAGELVERAAGRMRLQAQRAGLDLIVQAPEPDQEDPSVLADAERMDQVLVNLIHNAIKFTQPGGTIRVGWEMREHDVVFHVIDSGVGIADAELERIFERFYKADRSRSGGGTGLGLSIARHLVESHGGTIWAESQVERGSAFYFSLPLAPQ